MKKFLTITLAIAMILTMGSISAFAATTNIDEAPGSDSADVKASYQAGSTGGTVYSVDIEWGSLEFIYTDAAAGTWNPGTHTYDGAITAAGWNCASGADEITITNHSNAAIKAELTYASDAAHTTVTGAFDQSTLNLDTADGIAVGSAPNATAKLTLSGTMAETAGTVTVGTVTVTIYGGGPLYTQGTLVSYNGYNCIVYSATNKSVSLLSTTPVSTLLQTSWANHIATIGGRGFTLEEFTYWARQGYNSGTSVHWITPGADYNAARIISNNITTLTATGNNYGTLAFDVTGNDLTNITVS